MTGTITIPGIGSGLDTESIVTGLVNASKGTLSASKGKAASTHAAVTTISDVSSLLSSLKAKLEALDESNEVGSYAATSSSSAVVVSAGGNALPGSYDVQVQQLAREQRTYSNTFSASGTALGQSGTLSLQVGGGAAVNVAITSSDSLDAIATKINSSGARVGASIFYDGSAYRLQVRGLDTGAANAVTLGEAGTSLGLSTPANTVQSAADAQLTIDGFAVTRSTNQVAGAIQGVTLALTATTTSAARVAVSSDSAGLQTKLQGVVDAYNAVVKKVHEAAGFGSVAATNPVLSGDSTLRGVTNRLSSGLLTSVGSGRYSTLGSIGVKLANDGTLSLDSAKLGAALSADAAQVTATLAGTSSSAGIFDSLRDLATSLVAPSTGLLALRSEALDQRATDLDKSVTKEQARLDRYAEALRKQFSQMDSIVGGLNNMSSYLSKIG